MQKINLQISICSFIQENKFLKIKTFKSINRLLNFNNLKITNYLLQIK